MNSIIFLGASLIAGFLTTSAVWAADAPLQERHRILDGGQQREFEIATDEVFQRGKVQRVEKIPAQPGAEAVRARAEQLQLAATNEVELVLYPRGGPRNEFTRRVLTKQLLVRLDPGVDTNALARAAGLTVGRQFNNAPGFVLLETTETGGALTAAEKLRGQRGVLSAEPQLARQRQRKFAPNDPLFSQQWHLRNTGQNGGTNGIDINITNVWNTYRGAGVTIGVVDDGLEMTHPDLTANVLAGLGRDFNDNDANPTPNPLNYDFHGTAAAGVIAARGNNGVGVTGVAFESSLVGLRLISEPTTDAQEHDAEAWNNQSIQIKNNSWGAPDAGIYSDGSGNFFTNYSILDGPGPLMKAALLDGVTTGRDSKGVIYIFAGGNGWPYEDANYDGYANSIYVTAVGAVDDQGFFASYSEPGACLAVSAPSSSDFRQGVTTTDLAGADGYNFDGATDEPADRSYTQTFGGTSSAAPVVSGVAALMLQANPSLGWRDVKEILMRSARVVVPENNDWITNRAGIHHNHYLGAGLVDAAAAVTMATNWVNLGTMMNFSLTQSNLSIPIPDGDTNGVTRTFIVTNENFRVEHITLTVDIPHAYYGDLIINVTSPDGLTSWLAEPRLVYDPDIGGYRGWTFSSVRHWGESAKGNWTVKIVDWYDNDIGTLNSLALEFHGSRPQTTLAIAATNQVRQLTVRAPAAGWKYAVETSANFTNWTTLSNVTVNAASQSALTDGAAATNRFYRARLLP